jgi:hypothetical protein
VNKLRASFLWVREDGGIGGILFGTLPNKSNSRTIGKVRRRGGRGFRPILMKDKQALALQEAFGWIVLRSRLGAAIPLYGATNGLDLRRGVKPLHFEAHVHGDFTRDLDVELLPDLLQKAGVINNDRAIRSKRYRWTFTTSKPRVEFFIRAMQEGD